jgi:hypothetical protein
MCLPQNMEHMGGGLSKTLVGFLLVIGALIAGTIVVGVVLLAMV